LELEELHFVRPREADWGRILKLGRVGELFPNSPVVREQLEEWHSRILECRPSNIKNGGWGIFFKERLRAGMLVGIYAGTILDQPNEAGYCLEQQDMGKYARYIDARPTSSSMEPGLRAMGRINEWIWDLNRNCCEFGKGFMSPLVILKRDVEIGEEAYMAYAGDGLYSWDGLKQKYLADLCGHIREAARVMGYPVTIRLRVTLNRIERWEAQSLSSRRTGAPLEQAVMGALDRGDSQGHNFQPLMIRGEAMELWIHRLLTCEMFRRAVHFYKMTDPGVKKELDLSFLRVTAENPPPSGAQIVKGWRLCSGLLWRAWRFAEIVLLVAME
jgi:hypothetical protein